MKTKILTLVVIIAIISLLFLVPIATAADDNQEYEWRESIKWENVGRIIVKVEVNISASGIFGLPFGSPYVLIEFMFSPENANPTGTWIEVVYDGPQDDISKRLSYDEANKAFWFPLTQVKLSDSRWKYPINTYSTNFVIPGDISLVEGEENIDSPEQRFLKTNISWGGNTISLKIERENRDAFILLSLFILLPFLVIFGCSIMFFNKSIKRLSIKTPKEWVGSFLISIATALGFVYLILAGIGAELMPVLSMTFGGLILIAFIIFWFYTKKVKFYKLLQNQIPPYLIMHLAEKFKFNDMLSSRQRKDFDDLSNLKMRGIKLTQDKETYLENLLLKIIDEGIIEANCKDESCFSCEKLRKIKKLLRT